MRYNIDEEPPCSDLSIFASRDITVYSSTSYYSTSEERKGCLAPHAAKRLFREVGRAAAETFLLMLLTLILVSLMYVPLHCCTFVYRVFIEH
jgi:hypothetical protein